MSDVVILEPLARSTGHQSWFLGKLMEALREAGLRPMLITFDGMHEDADLEFCGVGLKVSRVSSLVPGLLRWLFGKLTGIKLGTTAAPSRAKRPLQIYLYNQLATVISVLYSCRAIRPGTNTVLHLLCPPSWLTLYFFRLMRRENTKGVVTAFVGPHDFGGSSALRKRLCRDGIVIIVVQTEALAAEWAREVGRASVRVIPLASGSDAGHTDRRECRRLLDLPEDKPIIAVIGCLTPAKGYIELFESIKGMQKDFRVLLIGDTPAWISPNPAEIAQEAGWLADTIFRKNFVPESQMPSLFGAIDAAALLYRKPNGSSGILSLCRQFGVPVIATCFGEIGALVRSERLGITANPADPEAVRLAIAHVLASDSDKTPNGTTAKSGGRSWAATGEAHALLYSELQGVERQGDRTTGDSVEQLGR